MHAAWCTMRTPLSYQSCPATTERNRSFATCRPLPAWAWPASASFPLGRCPLRPRPPPALTTRWVSGMHVCMLRGIVRTACRTCNRPGSGYSKLLPFRPRLSLSKLPHSQFSLQHSPHTLPLPPLCCQAARTTICRRWPLCATKAGLGIRQPAVHHSCAWASPLISTFAGAPRMAMPFQARTA